MSADEPLLDDLAIFAGRPVPSWVQDKRVHEIRAKDAQDCWTEPIDLNRTAGPAVQWGLSTLVGLTYFLTALPIVGTYIARCPAEATSHAFAHYEEVLLWIIFFVPLTIIVLAAQWKVSTFVLVPMFQQIRKHGKNDREFEKQVPFTLWLFVLSALTVFNLLDQMTNALFTAKTWATKRCYGYHYIDYVWRTTLHESSIHRMPVLRDLDFAEVTAWTYGLQLAVQTFVALYFSVPVCCQRRKADAVREEDRGKGWPVDYNVVMDRDDPVAWYKTLSDNQCNTQDLTDHGSTAMILAEVNRMEVVVAEDLEYRKALVRGKLGTMRIRRSNAGGAYEDVSSKDQEQCLNECLEIATAAAGRGIARFCLKGLLQNAVQVNLQVSMLAISKVVLDGGMDDFNAFTLGITIVSMFFDIPDIIVTTKFAGRILQLVQEEPGAEKLEKTLRSLRRRYRLVIFFSAAYAMLALYAMVKLVMAFVCPAGPWNMSLASGKRGCVDLDLLRVRENVTTCPVAEYVCDT